MRKNIIFRLLFLPFMFSSCTVSSSAPFSLTPGNVDEYLAPTYTPRPIPTPFPKRENGEIVLLLRKRAAPFEVVALRLPDTCLLGGEICNADGNLLGVLPQSLSQVLEIYWTNDGNRAFFWDDNTADIYVLNGNEGVFTVFKNEIRKVRNDFLISPNGESIMFETQKGNYETDLVMMNSSSGDILKFDIPVLGAKYVSQWIDNNTILFWDEISEGKGYLIDLNVYMLNTLDRNVQPFDIGRDWMETSVPVFSPDREAMVFTAAGTIIIRDVSGGVENTVHIAPEKFLWSLDSQSLVIYSQNKEIFTVGLGGSNLQKLYSLLENEYLEDWMWLSDNTNILLITSDEDGNRRVGVFSIAEKTFIPLNLSLLNQYDPVSFSFRP